MSVPNPLPDIILKRASDLESIWLGVTEKNIAAAFAQAEESGAILFIDEADSFFTERGTAFRSWEITRTNELLTRMESHSGILVCCTNAVDTLDRASLRRFHWKVGFKPPTPRCRISLYARIFAAFGPLSPGQQKRILDLDGLTPGDMRAVHGQHRHKDPAEVSHDALIAALERELSYRPENSTAKMGF